MAMRIRGLVGVLGMTAAMVLFSSSTAGCGVEPLPEQKASTQSRLLAPKPMMKAKASKVTRDELGIYEWRIYRGKRDVILTGYDKKGHPVKGLAAGFGANKDDQSQLVGRVLDGSRFSSTHTFHSKKTSAAAKTLAGNSQDFVTLALNDVAKMQKHFHNAPKTVIGAECVTDLTSILLLAMQCIGTQVTNQQVIAQCIQAAQVAATTGQACAGTGTGTGTTTPIPPNTGGGAAPLPPANGGTAGGGVPLDLDDVFFGDDDWGWEWGAPIGGGGMNLPNGGGANLPNGGGSTLPNSGTASDFPNGGGSTDPFGDPLDPFGDGATCLSCDGGGYDDISADWTTGEVNAYEGGYDDGYADAVADYEGIWR